jgi:multidrug efflux pump subunit AcrA (membrane-fusion protein)
MKLKPIILVLVIVLAGAALVVHKKRQLAEEKPAAAMPVVVSLREVKTAPVILTEPTIADVLAVKDAVLSSRLSAYVVSLPLFEGQAFKRGTVLVRLAMSADGHGPMLDNSLQAEQSAAASGYRAEEERLQRSRKLYDIGGVSLEQLQATEVATAAAKARLVASRENLHNTTLTAPFDGVVSQRLVQSGDLATPGKPLLKVVDMSAGVRLVLDMPDGVVPAGLLAGGQTLPLTPWPEASPQGSRRYEARTFAPGFAPGSRAPVKAVLFSGPGILIPRGCTLNSDAHQATVLRISDGKAMPLSLVLAAQGEQGAVTLDIHVQGAIACASPDILARLQAGAPFTAGK